MDGTDVRADVERAKVLLGELDVLARGVDHCAYGLPRFNDDAMARMCELVAAHDARLAAERDRLEKALALEREANAALTARVAELEGESGESGDPPERVTQMGLVGQMLIGIDRAGVKTVNGRQVNAVIRAADDILAELLANGGAA